MLRVASRTVEIDRVVRRAAEKGVARHDHPRHPEEEDLGGGDEHVRRIKGGEIARLLVRPAERGHRPEPGREPGVENILVLAHRTAAVWALGEILAAGDHLLRRITVVAVPDGNAMSPPE